MERAPHKLDRDRTLIQRGASAYTDRLLDAPTVERVVEFTDNAIKPGDRVTVVVFASADYVAALSITPGVKLAAGVGAKSLAIRANIPNIAGAYLVQVLGKSRDQIVNNPVTIDPTAPESPVSTEAASAKPTRPRKQRRRKV